MKFPLDYLFFSPFLVTFNIHFVVGSLDASDSESRELISTTNAFTGCIIRVINFKGKQIDFQRVNEPIILLRYLPLCEEFGLVPFELGSVHLGLTQNSTSCKEYPAVLLLTLFKVALNYVSQTFKESFLLKNNKQVCEADVYLYPPTEQKMPQMFSKQWYWESALLTPHMLNSLYTLEAQKWKLDYLSSVPKISLLICDSAMDSICLSEKDIKKWVAGVLAEVKFFQILSFNLLIWESSSRSLKTLCPYCDPCDSLKTVSLSTKIIPTSRKELEMVLLESQQVNPDPHTIRVVLIIYLSQYEDLEKKERRSRNAVLEHIKAYSLEDDDIEDMHALADIYLTSLLLPKHANITFTDEYDEYKNNWNNVISDSCSKTKPIKSHFLFRPFIERHFATSRSQFQDSRLILSISHLSFVSCHKEQVHWISQLRELISPFDIPTWLLILTIVLIVSCLVNLSARFETKVKFGNYFDIVFFMLISFFDQSANLFSSASKSTKRSLIICVYFVPISWLYLSTLYKGDNVTRLTAEPQLTQFDTFEMLEKNQFTTYSRRINLEASSNAKYINTSILAKLQSQYGRVATHEAIPFVSELWSELMRILRPVWGRNELSLNYLKHEISKQMWKYINNTAMLPGHDPDFFPDVYLISETVMNTCNKSAIIVDRTEALILHKILQKMNKPSFLGKDKILEKFWGYQFQRHFPSHLILRGRYLFEAGVFEWWQKYLKFSFNLKLDVHDASLYSAENHNDTNSVSVDSTAVAVLTLIPGVGFILSIILFIFAENISNGTQRKKLKTFMITSKNIVVRQYISAGEFIFKLRSNLVPRNVINP